MKIKATIQTQPALRVTFEIDDLDEFKSANDFAAMLQDVQAFKLPLPKNFSRRLSKAFQKAWAALPEVERLKFMQPGQVLTELQRMNRGHLAELEKGKAELLKRLP